MSKNTAKQGVYPGWWIVITSIFLMAIVFASVISLPGVFTVYVTEELALSRTAFTTHMTLSTLGAMLASLFVGKLLQKHNIKRLMLIFTIVATLCFIGYSAATQLWHFYVISSVLGFSCMFLTNIPISILVNNWFGPKLKGKAMGIAMTGSGIGAMILNPVLSYINSAYSWRTSYRLLALLTALLIPLVLLTIAKTPQEKGWEKKGELDNAPPEGTLSGLTVSQALKSKMFWIIIFTFLLFSVTTTVFNTNGIPYFIDIGFDAVKAGTMMSLASAAVIAGKLILGAACDKWGAKRGAAGAIAFLMIGLVFLISASNFNSLAFVAVIIFGLGNALGTVTIPLIVGELFGNRDYGALVGFCNLGSSLGAGIGPLMGAIIYDRSGSYIAAWTSAIILMLVMLGTMLVAYKTKASAYAKVKEA